MTNEKLEAAFRKWFTTHYPEPDKDEEKDVVDCWCYKFDIARTAFIAGYASDYVESQAKQLQAETQRADKAEEMVASLASLLQYHSVEGTAPGYLQSIMKSYDASNLETAAPISKAVRQKLCDEIVGKIEARYDKDCNSNQEYFVGFCVGLLKAIDIVKSVLK